MSPPTVGKLLRKLGYSLRVKVKKQEASAAHPERNRQFEAIQAQRQHFEAANCPIISVDTKKKELIGNFKNAGRAWKEQPEAVNAHDFPQDAVGKAVPYGIYDVRRNCGTVYVGSSADTPEFAVAALARWWEEEGKAAYPEAKQILILADSGGSNGCRPRRWKQQWQEHFADRYGLTVVVSHYPTGCSKWNPIEHRLFSQISQNWAGIPFIVMEYASGGSLQARLERHPNQPFPIEEAITILTHIGEAWHYAHQQNIVHRDLKPDNILFNSKGEALLADFGLAAILSSARTRDMGSGGTPAYMAPEMFEGKVSVKSDQYALGCIAYELVTGRKPIETEGLPVIAVQYQHAKVEPVAPTQHNPRISLHIEQAILKAMAKDRTNRHADVRVFLAALQTPQKSAQEWLKEGNALKKLNRNEEAIAAYDQALRLNPNYAHAYNNKGYTLNDRKRDISSWQVGDISQLSTREKKRYNQRKAAIKAYFTTNATLDEISQRYRLSKSVLRLMVEKCLKLHEDGTPWGYRALLPGVSVVDHVDHAPQSHSEVVEALAYNNKGNALDQLGRKSEAQQAREKAKQLGYGS